MGSIPKVLVAAVLLVIAPKLAGAAAVPQPKPVAASIAQADAIAVVSVESCQPDASQPAAPQGGAAGMVASFQVQPASKYKFKTLQVLKGKLPAELEIQLPMVSAFYYNRNAFKVQEGSRVLLLLSKEGNGDAGTWVAEDPLLPLFPLSPGMDIQPTTTPTEVTKKEADVIDVLASSLSDASLKPVIIHILHKIEDPRLVEVMHPFEEDRDLLIRSQALYCLAINQDVSAIPKIADLEARLEKERNLGSEATLALTSFKTTKAVEFLNPLVQEGPEAVRSKAMSALAPLADRSSIPFLMYALEHDDSQKSVSYDAYKALHRIIGTSLAPAGTRGQFLARRDDEIQLLKQWWEWEQVKEKKEPQVTTQPTSQPDNSLNPSTDSGKR